MYTRIIKKIKQLICNHSYKEYVKDNCNYSKVEVICEKCNKKDFEFYITYEG